MDFLNHLFAGVCGQQLEHTWAPGGILLPLCQRCTGLYAGAGTAALLHLCVRPCMSRRFIEVHGLFLLIMIPFGFHWVPQGPLLRAASGFLFGMAVFTFLWLPVNQRLPGAIRSLASPTGFPENRLWIYTAGAFAALIAIPCLGMFGGKVAALQLLVLVCWGMLALAGAILVNVGLGAAESARILRRLPRRGNP